MSKEDRDSGTNAADTAAYAARAAAPAPSATAKAKAPKAVDKSGYDRSIKVSPATVAAVKSAGKGNMGVNAEINALSRGAKYNGSSLMQNQPASPEYKEAVRRVYPNVYTQSKNKMASGRTNSPYGEGGFSQTTAKKK
jgi:hypothetical protein